MGEDRRYSTFVVRAWTKEGLALAVNRKLDPYPADAIVTVQCGVDFQFPWPFRRNWALLVVNRPEAPS
jgi:hypothetical protein